MLKILVLRASVWFTAEASFDVAQGRLRARPSTKAQDARLSSAHGELVEPCVLCASVVNTPSQETQKNRHH